MIEVKFSVYYVKTFKIMCMYVCNTHASKIIVNTCSKETQGSESSHH